MAMALPTHHPLDSWLVAAGPMGAYQDSDMLHTDLSRRADLNSLVLLTCWWCEE